MTRITQLVVAALIVAGAVYMKSVTQGPLDAPSVYAQDASGSAPLILGPGAKQSDPKAIAIIDRYLEALGGQDMLSKIADRRIAFTNTLYQPTGEAKAEIDLMIKGHYSMREEWKLNYEIATGQPLAFVQVYDGDTEEGWVQVLGRVDALEGKTLQVFVYGKYMDDFFCHWKQDGYTLTLDGEAEVDMTDRIEPCDIVRVKDFTGRSEERYFFSRESGLLLKKEWRDTSRDPSKAIRREQFYKRYRTVPFMDDSGLSIRVAMQLDILGDGDLDTERLFRTVQFNGGLSSELFERPAGDPGPVIRKDGAANFTPMKKSAEGEVHGGSKLPGGGAKKKAEGRAKKKRKAEGSRPQKRAKKASATKAGVD